MDDKKKSDILNMLHDAADDKLDIDFDISPDDEDEAVFGEAVTAEALEDDELFGEVSASGAEDDKLFEKAMQMHKKEEMDKAREAIEEEKRLEAEKTDPKYSYAKTKTDAELEEEFERGRKNAQIVAKKKNSVRYRMKRSKASYAMMAPYFILFFTFTVLPVVMSIGLSFTYFNMLEAPKFNGWANYIKLFLHDDIFIISLKNTLIFAVITGPISYILCLLFAWIINEFRPKVRTFLTLIFYAPSICGNAYMVWSLILSSDRYGYLNGLLMKLGLIDEQRLWMQDTKYILPCLIVVQLWLSLGTGFLSFIAGLQTVDKSLYEAAAIDGVKNRWQELWYVTLPAMKPQLMFGAVMQITQSFAVADISIQLAGNPSVNYAGSTVVTHLLDYGSTRFDMGYASAIATVLFLLMVGTNKLVQRLLRRVGE